MTVVKREFFRPEEMEVVALLHALRQRVSARFDPAEWDGLRISHLRVIHTVPADGISVTGLAERLGMTKQGCGQFVSQLVESGHLWVDPSPDDRRLRLVVRTGEGERLMQAQHAHFETVEQGWADQVGPRRYATFRKVLEELALDD